MHDSTARLSRVATSARRSAEGVAWVVSCPPWDKALGVFGFHTNTLSPSFAKDPRKQAFNSTRSLHSTTYVAIEQLDGMLRVTLRPIIGDGGHGSVGGRAPCPRPQGHPPPHQLELLELGGAAAEDGRDRRGTDRPRDVPGHAALRVQGGNLAIGAWLIGWFCWLLRATAVGVVCSQYVLSTRMIHALECVGYNSQQHTWATSDVMHSRHAPRIRWLALDPKSLSFISIR